MNTAKKAQTLRNPSVQFLDHPIIGFKVYCVALVVLWAAVVLVDIFLLTVIKRVRHRFGWLYVIKDFLSIDETPPALKLSFKTATTDVKRVWPTVMKIKMVLLIEILSSAGNIHVKSFTDHAGKTG